MRIKADIPAAPDVLGESSVDKTKAGNTEWATNWLDSVASGKNTMSQRKLSVIEKRGGIEAVKRLAEERGIHLLQIEDDSGSELIAASLKPFKVIC